MKHEELLNLSMTHVPAPRDKEACKKALRAPQMPLSAYIEAGWALKQGPDAARKSLEDSIKVAVARGARGDAA
jgi:hypothetical protein